MCGKKNILVISVVSGGINGVELIDVDVTGTTVDARVKLHDPNPEILYLKPPCVKLGIMSR